MLKIEIKSNFSKLLFLGKHVKKEKNTLDILAVILDVGLTIDNSSVFQSQVLDNLYFLKKWIFIGILCVYQDKNAY